MNGINTPLKIAAGAIITLLVFGGILFVLVRLNLLPTIVNRNQTQNQPANLPQLEKLTISCPVPSEYCSKKEELKYKNNPAIVYKIPKGVEIKTILPATEYRDFAGSIGEIPVVGLLQTYGYGTDCYTVIYSFPDDVKIQPSSIKIQNQSTITTSDQKVLNIDKTEASVIIQIRSLSADKLGKTLEEQKCSVENLKKVDFGQYIDPSQLF